MAFPQVYQDLLARVKSIVPQDERQLPEIPDDPDKLTQFIYELYEDARKYRESAFFNRLDILDPVQFWTKCLQLESGDHWKVWGSRHKDPKLDEWKAELTDEEIGNQIRIKTAYLTANWHKFDVLPNVGRINEVIHHE